MKRSFTGALAALILSVAAASGSPDSPLISQRLASSYGKLPLSFEPNKGQTDSRVQFVSRGAGYTIFVTPRTATFSLRNQSVVRMDLIGANSSVPMQPEGKLPGTVNYLMGSTRTTWPTGLPTYAKVRSTNVYPGIDLIYYGTQGSLEYDFVLAPQADASKIRLKFAGATPVVDSSGDLVLSLGTQGGADKIRFHKPEIYQLIAGARQPVNGRFTVSRKHEIAFVIAPYDHARELVIDPVLAYSSYLGGSSQQSVINGMTVNGAGQVYVTGVTNAIDYPTTPGVIEETCPAPFTGGAKCGPSSSSAAFVSKISADGQSLIYSTYLGGGGSGPGVGGSTVSVGGSGSDAGTSIAVDANDNAWILGQTNSNNFPVTADAFSLYCQPASTSFDFSTNQNVGEFSACARYNSGNEYNYSGGYSLFLVKLNPTGTSILYGTFLGGTEGDVPGQIALDSAGLHLRDRLGVQRREWSRVIPPVSIPFPTTASAFQPVAQQNNWCPFVSVFYPDGQALEYSSFLSSATGQAFGGPIALGAGKVFIGGSAQSPTFPTTPGALSSTCPATSATQCPSNGFVAEFDPSASGAASLIFSTYLNGKHVSTAGLSYATSTVAALAADSSGNVYVGRIGSVPRLSDHARSIAAHLRRDSERCLRHRLRNQTEPGGIAHLVHVLWLAFSQRPVRRLRHGH